MQQHSMLRPVLIWGVLSMPEYATRTILIAIRWPTEEEEEVVQVRASRVATVSTVVSRITERNSVSFASTDHHWPRKIVLAFRVGWHPFRVHLDWPSPVNLVSLHYRCINISSSSILLSASTSTALWLRGTRDMRKITRHFHQGVRVLVTTRLLVLEQVLVGWAGIRAEAKVRLMPRHMRCKPLIIMTPLQVLLLTVCYLFLVLGPRSVWYRCIIFIHIYLVWEYV